VSGPKAADNNLRKQRSEKVIILQYGVLIVLVLAAIVIIAFDPPGSSGTSLTATVIAVRTPATEVGPKKILSVRLATGEEVDLPDSGLKCAEKGGAIIVEERVTMVMKRKTYALVRCAD